MQPRSCQCVTLMARAHSAQSAWSQITGRQTVPLHPTTRKGALAVTKESPPHQGNRSRQNVAVQPESAGLLTLPHARAPQNVSTGILASVVVKALI